MEALELLLYAFGVPAGAGGLLYVLWRLEDELLGPPSSGFPVPDGEGVDANAREVQATVTEPAFLFVVDGIRASPNRGSPSGG